MARLLTLLFLWLTLIAQTAAVEKDSDNSNAACPDQCNCKDRLASQGPFKVDCSNGPLTSLSDLTLPSVTTQLSITGQRVSRIRRDDLSSLTGLVRLNLSANMIESVDVGAFRHLNKLVKLDLSNNKLTSINRDMLQGLEQLKKLSLSGNRFSVLPEDLFIPAVKLEKIDFQTNQLRCDCRLEGALRYLREQDVTVQDTKCAEPQLLKDVQLRNLDTNLLACHTPTFELQPSEAQLAYTGDTLRIDCKVSNDPPIAVYWMRRGRRVTNNKTAGIAIREDSAQPELITLTLRLEKFTVDNTGTWTCVVETARENKTRSINVIAAYCEAKLTNTSRGVYYWPQTSFNTKAQQRCKVGDDGNIAYYTCNNQGQWSDLDLSGCKYSSEVTQLLFDLSVANFSDTDKLALFKTMKDMMAQSPAIISNTMDVVYVSRILKSVGSSYQLCSKKEIPHIIFNITSLMMNVNRKLLQEAERLECSCTNMMDNLLQVADHVLESKNSLQIYVDNIAMEARKIHPATFIGLTCTAYQSSKLKMTYLSSNFYCEEKSSTNLTSSHYQKLNAVIHIPSDVKDKIRSTNFKLAVTVFRNDNLFQAASQYVGSSSVSGSVMSAKMIGHDVDHLVEPVIVALPRQESTAHTAAGVVWDRMSVSCSSHSWESEHCKVDNTFIHQRSVNLSVFKCSKMGSYGLEQVSRPSIYGSGARMFSIMRPQFYVGSTFLSICLLATIFTYLCGYSSITLSRKLKHSLINTCWSVVLLKAVFILGVKMQHDIACKVLGIAIHYFSITSIFWMTIVSWNIYKKMNGKAKHRLPPDEGGTPLPPNPMLKFYLFAWGIPVIVCGITGAVNLNFYKNINYCFVAWKPGLLAFYGVIGLFVLINCVLYICICCTRDDNSNKVYVEEMVVLNSDGSYAPRNMDDSLSQVGSLKSSITDNEYKPLAQMAGIILFLILYILMWASAAFSVVLKTETDSMDVILSYLYMILCFVLGIFVVIFYCLARNDTRAMWSTCCNPPNAQEVPLRSNTNIDIITHTNANNSLGRQDSLSSLKDSSLQDQSNPLLQIMQYHKKAAMVTQPIVNDAHIKCDQSIRGSTENTSIFFNPRQNGIAKKYWERKRISKEHGMNNSILSVPESNRHQTRSPTNAEPTHHLNAAVEVRSHNSKHARRHRLGSTNSEPADARHNIYHSMPLSLSKLKVVHVREPAVGQSNTSSEVGAPMSYTPTQELWQRPASRSNRSQQNGTPSRLVNLNQVTLLNHSNLQGPTNVDHKQAYIHNYICSINSNEDPNTDADSQRSHRSQRSSQRSRRHRLRDQGAFNTSITDSKHGVQGYGTARSTQSSRSHKSSLRSNGRASVEKHMHTPTTNLPDTGYAVNASENNSPAPEDDKLNINHSSSDNNSSHYACVPVQDKILNSQLPLTESNPIDKFDRDANKSGLTAVSISQNDMSIPEERIYENAHKIVQQELPVYTNLEELRQQAAVSVAARSPEPRLEYELPVYENLFSLNEYDTLKKQKHYASKCIESQGADYSDKPVYTGSNPKVHNRLVVTNSDSDSCSKNSSSS